MTSATTTSATASSGWRTANSKLTSERGVPRTSSTACTCRRKTSPAPSSPWDDAPSGLQGSTLIDDNRLDFQGTVPRPTMIDVLRSRAEAQGGRPVFTYLANGE